MYRSAAAAFAALVALAVPASAAVQKVVVALDEAKILTFDKPAASIIVGNPAVADISVQDDRTALLFGKAPGSTNILVLDASGGMIDEFRVSVANPSSGVLVIQRGIRQATYTCVGRCTPTPTIGDDTQVFEAANTQISARLSAAQQAAEAAGDGGDEDF